MRLEWLGGVAAIALLATIGSASAVTITPNTNSPLLNLGQSITGAGFHSAANITGAPLAGTGISAINFLGGANGTNLSGVYSGTVPNVATTPFPPFDGLGLNTPTLIANQNYLVAQPGPTGTPPGNGVQVVYTTPQASFEILWGTIDIENLRNRVVTFANGDIIDGATVLPLCGGQAGVANCELTISGLTGGTAISYIASDTSPNASAFEFVPGTAVPEPTSLAILGAALAGLGLLRRRKTA